MNFLKERRLSLSTPGTGEDETGGPTGGGGAASFGGDRPLPSKAAREEIENKVMPPDSGKPSEEGAPAAEPKKETPPGPASPVPDSEDPTKGKPKAEEPAPAKKEDTKPPVSPPDTTEKRLRDTQAALHKAIADGKTSSAKLTELQAKLDLVTKYVDMDKLSEHDKAQAEKLMDEPVTLRQLQETISKLQTPHEEKPTEETPSGISPEDLRKEQEKWVGNYLENHPHMKPHFEAGAAIGVAQKIGAEHPDWTLDQIGEEVSKHFLGLESGIERRVSERLTKTRESLSEGASPSAGTGTPVSSTSTEDTTQDTPGGEVARRRAVLAGQRRFLT